MNARLKPLLILAGALCVCLLALVAYACILQLHGWYHGAPEEGIAGTPVSGRRMYVFASRSRRGATCMPFGKMPPLARPL